MTDWKKMLDDAKAENANGIEMRRGKKYTSVAVRLEIARRHLGGAMGIETEIVRYGAEKGDPIVVRATIRDGAGLIIGQGTAEEIRGQGQVNSTSALENAETSAIGRALAMLGLSGGEFASANEMEAVERKKAAPAAPLSEQAAPAGPREDRVLTKAMGEAILQGIAGCANKAALSQYVESLHMGPNAFAAHHPKIKVAISQRYSELDPLAYGDVPIAEGAPT